MSAALSMTETAHEAGLSAERFRKVWRTWARDLAFPPPFKTPGLHGRGTYAWDADDVAAWKAGRKQALGAHAPALNDNPAPAPAAGSRQAARLTRERAELAAMMGGRS